MSSETNNTSGIISKVWSFCNTLRDDGLGYASKYSPPPPWTQSLLVDYDEYHKA